MRARLCHRLGPLLAQADEVCRVERSGGRQGHHLSIAVTTEGIGDHTQAVEQPGHRQPGHPQGGLGHAGVVLGNPLAFGPTRNRGGRREHECEIGLAQTEELVQPGKSHEQLRQHGGTLAALPGEEEGQPPRPGPVGAEIDPLARTSGGCCGELGPQVFHARGHDRRAGRARSPVPKVASQIAQPGPVWLVESTGQALDLLGEGPSIFAAKAEQLGRPALQPVGGLIAVVRIHDHVEVGSAEPERTDTRAPARFRPRQGRPAEGEWAGEGVVGCARMGDVRARGAHGVVQGQACFDEPGHARRAFGVPDLGFHGAEGAGARRAARIGEEAREGRQLGPVADDCAGAVSLDEADRCW